MSRFSARASQPPRSVGAGGDRAGSLLFLGTPLSLARILKAGFVELPGAIHYGRDVWLYRLAPKVKKARRRRRKPSPK